MLKIMTIDTCIKVMSEFGHIQWCICAEGISGFKPPLRKQMFFSDQKLQRSTMAKHAKLLKSIYCFATSIPGVGLLTSMTLCIFCYFTLQRTLTVNFHRNYWKQTKKTCVRN